jgi:hypothetical protein
VGFECSVVQVLPAHGPTKNSFSVVIYVDFHENTHLKKIVEIIFLFIFIMFIKKLRRSVWSSGENSWSQIQRSGLESRRYQVF